MNKTGFISLAACFVAWPCLAWDGAVTGTILGADVSSTATEAFRIRLSGLPALCGNANNWAYVASGDTRLSLYVGTLLAAKVSGETVTVYSNRDANGYCQIGYVSTQVS